MAYTNIGNMSIVELVNDIYKSLKKIDKEITDCKKKINDIENKMDKLDKLDKLDINDLTESLTLLNNKLTNLNQNQNQNQVLEAPDIDIINITKTPTGMPNNMDTDLMKQLELLKITDPENNKIKLKKDELILDNLIENSYNIIDVEKTLNPLNNSNITTADLFF